MVSGFLGATTTCSCLKLITTESIELLLIYQALLKIFSYVLPCLNIHGKPMK